MRHFVVATIIVVLVTVAGAVLLDSAALLPPLASAQGITIDWLFDIHMKLIVFLFALVVVFMMYSIIVFRREPGDLSDGQYIHGNTRLEIAWTVIPLIIVGVMGYIGVVTLRDVTASAPDEMVVEVTGAQWSWRFDYPELGLTSTELVLPVNQPIRFEITSTDVIHNLWVPEFRVKQDAVPGAVNLLRVTPTVVGNYKVRCAELCGLGHATMMTKIRVIDKEEFKKWITENRN